jgi:2,4-diaminopentanoate dehydrogenase
VTRLVLVGAGRVGVDAAKACRALGVVHAVAAVADTSLEARNRAGVELSCDVVSAAGDLPEGGGADVALLAFSSSAQETATVAEALLGRGYHVVTTCEELSDPDRPERERLDRMARSVRRNAVATGANPGFVMDGFALAVARGSAAVTGVRVTRRVDTATRRDRLVAKTGRGLTEAEFRSRAGAGGIGHVGLAASARLLAAGLGWRLVAVDELIEPVLGGDEAVAGLHQRATGRDGDGRVVTLDLVMAWGLTGPVDRIEVDGIPPLVAEIIGGYPGDEGTTARVVRAVEACSSLQPGFHLPAPDVNC